MCVVLLTNFILLRSSLLVVIHLFSHLYRKNGPIYVKDYRPISLIGVQYKIIAKLLANRLRVVIDCIISPEQFAFVKGRQILDGPFLVNEIIDWYKKKKRKS